MSRSDKIWIALAFFVLIGIISYPIAYKLSAHDVIITVTEKERWTNGQEGKYLVHCGSKIYENSDSFLFLKFNSVNVQNELKLNKTYTVKVAGWRAEIGSQFENIIEIYCEGDLPNIEKIN